MRGAQCVLALAVFLPGMFGALSSPCASDEGVGYDCGHLGAEMMANDERLLICAAMPNFASESVTIENVGNARMDLKGWTLTDGEGWLTFSKSRTLDPGDRVSVCSNVTIQKRLVPGEGTVEFASSELARKGRFALADDGDEITLLRPNACSEDRLIYGMVQPEGSGWKGTAVEKPPAGAVLARMDIDTNSSSDWTVSIPRREAFGPFEGDAFVEPFLCPEEMRGRLVREFEHAQFSIDIAIYEIGDSTIGHALVDAIGRGLQVRVLVDGQPVGGMPETELSLLDTLNAASCDVHMIKSFDGYRGYDFLHCKYAVIDTRRVVVTSENWMRTSLDSNRGWGAVIENEALAADFAKVFESDFDLDRLDVSRYTPSGDYLPLAAESDESDASVGAAISAEVKVLFSPGASLQPMRSLVQNASSRILIELLYLEPNMLMSDGLVQDVLDAAARGVVVRILLDGGYYLTEEGGDNDRAKDYLESVAEEGSDVEVRFSTQYHEFGLIHNKGMIIDDIAVISSINWGIGPFVRNREAALVIESWPVADLFAIAFASDWQSDLSIPSIIGVPGEIEMERSGSLTIDAGNCSDPAGIASYEWDLGVDGSIDWRGATCYFDIGSPTVIRLTVRDHYNNSATQDIQVTIAAPV
ncbi:MAG: phospholipase D-like domain-containing protein, partial [Methanomassiliicoccales archaeon]|nr:phospholipase D-like domain-containing protein [Methanomassiliicoccales archaeon]